MARPKPFQIALAAVAAAAVAGLLWVKVLQPQMTETMADKMGRGDYALTAATTLAKGGRRSGRTQTRPGVGSNECQATILERS